MSQEFLHQFNFNQKKIGIWGFGIVGKSILRYLKPWQAKVTILDLQPRPSDLDQNIDWMMQPNTNLETFFTDHDYIIISPGIILNAYPTILNKYNHKIIHEIDIFAHHNTNPTIAITGTVGKTTITSMLAQSFDAAQAAGNIGYAMLDTLNDKSQKIILELSSYQLEYSSSFAPDLAIWTNFYPNHLDHHLNEEEYFQAKCNILKFQKPHQKALLFANLWPRIQITIPVKSTVYLFSLSKIETDQNLFYIHNNQVVLKDQEKTHIIFTNFNQLPPITFPINWLMLIATWHLQGKDIQAIQTAAAHLIPEPHRLELIKTNDSVLWYNDSKSTIWQATVQAIESFPQKKIALFVGGLSKGVDRTPLFQTLQHYPSIMVIAFGKEQKQLQDLSKQYRINCLGFETLQEAINTVKQTRNNFDIVLFSPAGASFDLFKDFQDRGNQFKNMVLENDCA